MIGYRARLGFLLPAGNPTIEPEMIAMCPQGVSLHFNRMVAPGALDGQAERDGRYRRISPVAAHFNETGAAAGIARQDDASSARQPKRACVRPLAYAA